MIERLIDMAAERLGIARDDIRPPQPRSGIRSCRISPRSVCMFDSGDFASNMERVLETADWKGFAARRKESTKRGKLRGIGVANYVESPVGAPHERVDVRVLPEGAVELTVGTQSTRAGPRDQLPAGDGRQARRARRNRSVSSRATPRRCVSGGGTHSDRSMRLAGTLMVEASDNVVTQAKKVAAAIASKSRRSDVAFTDGLFVAPQQKSAAVDLRYRSRHRRGLPKLPDEQRKQLRRPRASPAACRLTRPAATICETRDRSGDRRRSNIERYTSLDDAGQPINPLILHGQVHGGIAQGVGPGADRGHGLRRDRDKC